MSYLGLRLCTRCSKQIQTTCSSSKPLLLTNVLNSSGLRSTFQTRGLKTKKENPDQFPTAHHEDFTLIYKFPKMKLVAGLSKFKLTQTLFFMAVSPLCYVSYYAGNISLLYANGVAGVAAFAAASLLYFSYVTRRFVGYIWLDNQKQNLKIAYLNFWANRKDVVIPVEHIELFDDPSQNYTKPLLRLKLLNSKDFYFLSIRYGLIQDKKLFRYVFGVLPIRAYDKFKSRNLK